MAKGFDGIEKFNVRLHKFSEDFALEKAKQVEKDLLRIARTLVPVDTGKLKDNLRTEIEKIKWGYRVTLYVDLGDVEYALYVEVGTRKMKAQPYITPATIMAFEKNFK